MLGSTQVSDRDLIAHPGVLGDESGQKFVQSLLEYIVDPGIAKLGVKLAGEPVALQVPSMKIREMFQQAMGLG